MNTLDTGNGQINDSGTLKKEYINGRADGAVLPNFCKGTKI